jgi:dihydrofolate reductase
MSIIGIVAVARNGAIGKGGTLPWRYPTDLKFFKAQTINHACVMGRKTWLSLKSPLPQRLNIVLSRTNEILTQPSLLVMPDRESVLALHRYLSCDLFIIGGAEVFRTFAGDIERWLVTEVPLNVEDADTFMPADFLQHFEARTSIQLEENLKATTYERINAPLPL